MNPSTPINIVGAIFPISVALTRGEWLPTYAVLILGIIAGANIAAIVFNETVLRNIRRIIDK